MSQRNRHRKWREWAAQLAAGPFFHLQPLWWKVERREASMHALGDWVSGISISEKVGNGKKEKLGRITKNKPEKFGPGQSFVVGV